VQAKAYVHSGTVTVVHGERSGFNIDGGTVTDASAVYVEPMIDGTTAISGALTGVNITSSNITAGLAANAYGLYIEDYSGKATTDLSPEVQHHKIFSRDLSRLGMILRHQCMP
jgi:hypothetical protein